MVFFSAPYLGFRAGGIQPTCLPCGLRPVLVAYMEPPPAPGSPLRPRQDGSSLPSAPSPMPSSQKELAILSLGLAFLDTCCGFFSFIY